MNMLFEKSKKECPESVTELRKTDSRKACYLKNAISGMLHCVALVRTDCVYYSISFQRASVANYS
jgi:hypothetical protein